MLRGAGPSRMLGDSSNPRPLVVACAYAIERLPKRRRRPAQDGRFAAALALREPLRPVRLAPGPFLSPG